MILEMEEVDPQPPLMCYHFKGVWCFHVKYLFILQPCETNTHYFVLLSSFVPDLVCTSHFAVSIRKEVKAKRQRQTAITRLTTSRPNSLRPRSFAHGTSSSYYERTSENSFPAPHTCLFTPAHHTHILIHRSWFDQKWRSWRATSTGESRKCCSTPCSVLTMWPSCLSALSRLVSNTLILPVFLLPFLGEFICL